VSLAQVSRLIYTNAGVALLALATNAVHKLWKWQRTDRNPTGKVGLATKHSTLPRAGECAQLTLHMCGYVLAERECSSLAIMFPDINTIHLHALRIKFAIFGGSEKNRKPMVVTYCALIVAGYCQFSTSVVAATQWYSDDQ
jgi:hypothetical protein